MEEGREFELPDTMTVDEIARLSTLLYASVRHQDHVGRYHG
jgi:hypothetical protein